MTAARGDGPGRVLRAAAPLPRHLFTDASAVWRLVVTHRAGAPAAMAADPAALSGGDRRAPWPPALRIDPEGRLELSGCPPDVTTVPHRVVVGVATATVEWDAPDAAPGPAPVLRLEQPGSPPIDLSSSAGQHADSRRVRVDLARVADAGAGVWTASLGGGTGAWQPLQLGEGARPVLAEVLVPRDRRTVRIGYSATAQLTFTVGGAA